jgi:hypothetical protein
VHGAAKIKLAAFPDDDPSLVIDVPLNPVKPQARVMSVQFVGENDGYLAVRERHAERLPAVVYLPEPLSTLRSDCCGCWACHVLSLASHRRGRSATRPPPEQTKRKSVPAIAVNH